MTWSTVDSMPSGPWVAGRRRAGRRRAGARQPDRSGARVPSPGPRRLVPPLGHARATRMALTARAQAPVAPAAHCRYACLNGAVSPARVAHPPPVRPAGHLPTRHVPPATRSRRRDRLFRLLGAGGAAAGIVRRRRLARGPGRPLRRVRAAGIRAVAGPAVGTTATSMAYSVSGHGAADRRGALRGGYRPHSIALASQVRSSAAARSADPAPGDAQTRLADPLPVHPSPIGRSPIGHRPPLYPHPGSLRCHR